MFNNQCEYAGTNNGVNYQNNQYNGYQYQNGYFYPQNYGGYNNYGNQYNNGWGLRGGIWFRYYWIDWELAFDEDLQGLLETRALFYYPQPNAPEEDFLKSRHAGLSYLFR